MTITYYDKEGRPLRDVHEWSRLLEDTSYRVVAFTETDEEQVSTVWIGLDHNVPPAGPPTIFETAVFGGKHNGKRRRYATLHEARLGHAAICKEVFG